MEPETVVLQPEPVLRRQEARQARRLARELGCWVEDEMATLGKVEIPTLRNWRARRIGPPFVTLGNVVLYPIASSREWLEKNLEITQSPPAAAAEGRQRKRK